MGEGRARRREEGFTLIELMISFVILALLVFAAFSLLDVNVKAGNVYAAKAELSQELREATSALVDQLRVAFSFTDAQSDSVSFTAYFPNTAGTDQLYNVQILREGSDLVHRMSTGTPSSGDSRVLASDVTGLTFTYYDSVDNELVAPVSQLEAIRKVKIELTMTKGSGDTMLSSTVTTVARVRK